MMKSIATRFDNVHIEDSIASQVVSNPLANIWLGVLAVSLLGTLFCTVVLLAWPILAHLFAG